MSELGEGLFVSVQQYCDDLVVEMHDYFFLQLFRENADSDQKTKLEVHKRWSPGDGKVLRA